ncbi:MAG: hypothetical protein ACKVWR_04605 [Acidimicrobiales bacterium]
MRPYRRVEDGVGDVEAFPSSCEEAALLGLLRELFVTWWRDIRFGPLIQGAAYELRLGGPARLAMLDGYVTIDVGAGHLHLCIGEHRAAPAELARRRRCARAELYRIWLDGAPTSWGFRMFNGDDHQQLNVLLPNPFLDAVDRPLPRPDWGKLACWDALRARFLGLGQDAGDRLGREFKHG